MVVVLKIPLDGLKTCFFVRIICKTQYVKRITETSNQSIRITNTAVLKDHSVKILDCVKYNFRPFFFAL